MTAPRGKHAYVHRGWGAWLGRIGRALITLGLLMLAFVAYQLWGTGLYTARAQDRLEAELKEQLGQAASASRERTRAAATPSSGATTTATVPVSTAPAVPVDVVEGEPVGRLVAPAIGVDWVVVEGVSTADLKKGPGHYPGTPLPGQAGNAAIAGHRTTYGAPFYRINELERGDEIWMTTTQGKFRYVVTSQEIVAPSRVEVLDDFGDNRLTLTTCNPRYSARQRLIITAALSGAPAVVSPTGAAGRVPDGKTLPGEKPQQQDSIDGDLSGQQASAGPAVAWGAGGAVVWLGVWFLGRRWRRWPAYVAATPVFLAVLFVFFENVSRLLPANF